MVGRETPSGTLILPISRPGVEPLIFQLTDDRAAHGHQELLKWVSVSLSMKVCRHWEPPCSPSDFISVELWILKAPFHFRLICSFEVKTVCLYSVLIAKGEGAPGMLMTKCFSGERLLLKTYGVFPCSQSGHCWDSPFGMCYLLEWIYDKKRKGKKERERKKMEQRNFRSFSTC